MITDALGSFFSFVLTGLFGLMPSFTLPGSMTDFGAGIGQGLYAANGVLPVSTIGVCLAAVIAVRLFILSWSVLVWVYDKTPFKAT